MWSGFIFEAANMMKQKHSSFTWSLAVISHLISSHPTACFSNLSLIPSYPPKTQIELCHPSCSNIFYINSVTQIIWPKYHQASLLHSFTLSLSHSIPWHLSNLHSHKSQSQNYSITKKAPYVSQWCLCFDSYCFLRVPFHSLPKSLSYCSANVSPFCYEPRET